MEPAALSELAPRMADCAHLGCAVSVGDAGVPHPRTHDRLPVGLDRELLRAALAAVGAVVNRRGFISLLAGVAGAPLVPWRMNVVPRIFLPSLAPLVLVSGLEILQLGINPIDLDRSRPYAVNWDAAWIRADVLEWYRVNQGHLITGYTWLRVYHANWPPPGVSGRYARFERL